MRIVSHFSHLVALPFVHYSLEINWKDASLYLRRTHYATELLQWELKRVSQILDVTCFPEIVNILLLCLCISVSIISTPLVMVAVFLSICVHLYEPICLVHPKETVNLYCYILKWSCKSLAGIS